MTQTRHLKLISGEEIIGKVADMRNEDGDLFLDQARTLAMTPMGNNQVSIAMIPFIIGNPDAVVRIPRKNIAGEPQGETPKQLEDSYIQSVSNIAIATSGPTGKIQL